MYNKKYIIPTCEYIEMYQNENNSILVTSNNGTGQGGHNNAEHDYNDDIFDANGIWFDTNDTDSVGNNWDI